VITTVTRIPAAEHLYKANVQSIANQRESMSQKILNQSINQSFFNL